MEILLTDLGVITETGISRISILMSENRVRPGRTAVLEAVPEKQDRRTIDASGTLMMPTIRDHLSWISAKYTESDLKRHRYKLHQGGITSGYFEIAEQISRVGWLDVARRMKNIFDNEFGLYGNPSYVTRWRNLVGNEIPEVKMLISVDALKENREIAMCPAQEHRSTHVIEQQVAVKLWWMKKQFELIQEELGEKRITQDLINSRIAPEEKEKGLVQTIAKREAIAIGSTIKADCPFLISLYLDNRAKIKGCLGLPLRKDKIRKKLIENLMNTQNFKIAVGDYPLEWEEDIINNGYNIGGFALPLLIDSLKSGGYGLKQIFDRMYYEGTIYENAGITIPRNFVLIAKGGKRSLIDLDNKLPDNFRTPKYHIKFTQMDGKLVFEEK